MFVATIAKAILQSQPHADDDTIIKALSRLSSETGANADLRKVQQAALSFVRQARVCLAAAGLVDMAAMAAASPESELAEYISYLGLPSLAEVGHSIAGDDAVSQLIRSWLHERRTHCANTALPGSEEASSEPKGDGGRAAVTPDQGGLPLRLPAEASKRDEHDLQPDASREHLVRLPERFEDLLAMADHRVCSMCERVPQDASLCLVCGTVVCAFNQSCHMQDAELPNMVAHAQACGGGTGLFLLLSDSEVLMIYSDVAVLYPSPYLDSHGECDRGLNRGQPLFLNQRRYEALEAIWQSHSVGREAFLLSEDDAQEEAATSRSF